jgi:3-phenylpropionate/cinnamic acid dioxygenase small subunit
VGAVAGQVWVLSRSPVPAETRIAVQDFLVAEAELLDNRRFDDWLELFTDDLRYEVPVRTTRKRGNSDVSDEMYFFEENRVSLGLRVRRLSTDVAWAEDPPSHTRRFVTNFRFEPGPGESELTVRTNLLLYRSRGGEGRYDLICGEREDVLRLVESELKIARRRVVLDQSTLATKNLGVFL